MDRAAIYFFNQQAYPRDWDALSDEALIELYKETEDQRIVCFLMKRHKTPIVAISYSYLKNHEAVEDFVHDLYIRLVDKLKDWNVKNFSGFLVTVVKNKHKDELGKYKVREGYENEVISKGDTSRNEEERWGFIIDNPLAEKKLSKYHQEGLLSKMEYSCLRLRSQGYKPAEIAKLLDPEVLGLIPKKGQEDCPDFLQHNRRRVFGALERSYRKVREKLGNDFDGYFLQ